MVDDFRTYLRSEVPTSIPDEVVLREIESKSDLRIFGFESALRGDPNLMRQARAVVSARSPSFGRHLYDLVLRLFAEDFENVTEVMDWLIGSAIPDFAAANDNYFRILYFIAQKTGDTEHYMRAYEGMRFNIGLNHSSNFLQTRRHAYILDCTVRSDGCANTYRGKIVEPASAKMSATAMKVIGLLRMRNEANIIEQALATMSEHVDAIVVYDDGSDDETVEIVKHNADRFNVVALIENKHWLFNEALAHNKLFEAARAIGGTHFVQLDADEILSGAWLSDGVSLKAVLSSMRPGDCLALPWIDLLDAGVKLDRSMLVNKEPFFRGMMFKDIAYCDDGISTFDENNFIHVNIVPGMYRERHIVLDESFALLHLENVNSLNLVAKKDWYRVFEMINRGKKTLDSSAYNIRAELASWDDARLPYEDRLSNYPNFEFQAYRLPVTWRPKYVAKAIEEGFVPAGKAIGLYLDYDRITKDLGLDLASSMQLQVNGGVVATRQHSSARIVKLNARTWPHDLWFKVPFEAVIGSLWEGLVFARRGVLRALALYSSQKLKSVRVSVAKRGKKDASAFRVLAACLGRSQLHTIEALARERYAPDIEVDLIIYYKGAKEDELLQLANEAAQTGLFSNVYISQTVFDPQRLRSLRFAYQRDFWSAMTIESVADSGYKEIILPKLFHPPEKFLAETFQDAGIVLFDEGVRACIDMKVHGKTSRAYVRMTAAGIAEEHRARILAFYVTQRQSGVPSYIWQGTSFFVKPTGRPNFANSRIMYLHRKFTDVAVEPDAERSEVVLLTQNLAGARFCSSEAECQIYAQAISYIRLHGKKVAVKFHPRDPMTFRDRLREMVPDLEVLDDANTMSAEMVIAKRKPEAVIGLISSALLFCIDREICPAYTILGTTILTESVKWDADHEKIVKLVRSVVPPISFHDWS